MLSIAPAAAGDNTDDGKSGGASFFAEDGWLDISGFLDQAYGFMPLVVPITEPAVGYGAFGAAVFIDRVKDENRPGFGRPNITMIGGLRTDNGTRGGVAADLRHWMNDRLQTVAALFDTSINLDYFGTGVEGARRLDPVQYNLSSRGGAVRAKMRFGETRMWAGLGYVRADTDVSSALLSVFPGAPDLRHTSSVGGLTPTLSYDSRDNIFTARSGSFVELSAGVFDKALGSDTHFMRSNATAIQFLPLNDKWTFGVFASGTTTSGDVPFYLRPYIGLRGAPKMRYQGERTAEIEGEVRWQFWQRFSLVAFAGAGRAQSTFNGARNDKDITTRGIGFRYEIARKHGLHMGLDFAAGPDSRAVYVQFGSAWMRP